MAELKKIESYDLHHASPSVNEELEQQKEQLYLVRASQKKLKNISLMEKGVIILISVVFVSLAFATVTISTTITKTTEDITSIQQKIDMDLADIDKLEQEKNELSRAERLKEIAKNAGLVANDDNVRKVSK